MEYLLLVLSTITAAGKSVIFKRIGTDSSSSRQLFRSNMITYIVASLIPIAAAGFNFSKWINMSSYSFGMSFVFAACIVFTYVTQMRAMALGTASSTLLVYSCGFLIPIFYGAIFLDEKISLVQIFSIFILLGALILIINPEKNGKFSVKWLVVSLMSMCGTGTTAVCQKIHQRSEFASEFPMMLALAFIISAAVVLIILPFIPAKKEDKSITKKDIGTASLSGFFVGVVNLLNLSLAGKVPAVILFPTYNIGSIILSGIICAFMFKEKNTKKQIIGFIIGCVAILLIGLF
ncbi:MAG: hypothetical protein E7672_05940 [Ruminococcaceae bacterium]|nr:hypothetical protein [Oscillospiraceae bacterium]